MKKAIDLTKWCAPQKEFIVAVVLKVNRKMKNTENNFHLF